MSNRASEGRKRVGIVAIVAAIAVVAFAVVGGAGLAGNGKHGLGSSQYGMGQYQYGTGVIMCHKGKTITVSRSGWARGHKRHGDKLGACAASRKGKHGHHKGKGKGGDDDQRTGARHGSSQKKYSAALGAPSKGASTAPVKSVSVQGDDDDDDDEGDDDHHGKKHGGRR